MNAYMKEGRKEWKESLIFAGNACGRHNIVSPKASITRRRTTTSRWCVGRVRRANNIFTNTNSLFYFVLEMAPGRTFTYIFPRWNIQYGVHIPYAVVAKETVADLVLTTGNENVFLDWWKQNKKSIDLWISCGRSHGGKSRISTR